MSKSKPGQKKHPKVRTPHSELAAEVSAWDKGDFMGDGWTDAPDAVPRAGASKAISIRLPKTMLRILKRFAEKEGIGYQVLVKRWLDDRIRFERDRLAGRVSSSSVIRPAGVRYAPVVDGLVDREDINGPHYEWVA